MYNGSDQRYHAISTRALNIYESLHDQIQHVGLQYRSLRASGSRPQRGNHVTLRYLAARAERLLGAANQAWRLHEDPVQFAGRTLDADRFKLLPREDPEKLGTYHHLYTRAYRGIYGRG